MRWALHVRSSLTAGTIGSIGDMLMQSRERSQSLQGNAEPALDRARSARVAGFRALQAPIVDSAWRFFDARFQARGGMLAAGVSGAAARAVCDQCLLAPPSIAGFFVFQGLFEGLGATESMDRARSSFAGAYIIAFPFWTCTHMITFGVVQPNWRVAWASVIAVCEGSSI